MSEPRLFEEHPGKEFITTSDAARLASVSQTHIGRICRGGEIVCIRVGREWFVEKESLSDYLVRLAEKKRELAQKISDQRKKDYQTALSQKPLPLPIVPPTDMPTFESVTAHSNRKFSMPVLAPFAVALFLMVSAFSFASTYVPTAELFSSAQKIFTSETRTATALNATDSLSTSVRNTTTNFSQGIPWYERAWRFITSLFVRDAVVVVTPPVKVQPVVVTPVATTTTVVVREPVRVVQQPAPTTVIENITRSVILSGVSQTELANALTNLENKLRTSFSSTLSGITQVVGNPTPYYPAPSFGGIANTIALLNNIDKLANVEITGGSIT
ncbi:helix-turn-helix domain-containing protein, partial [Patescibacteria group bacterium]|nr:helix-turn-helix domain-containing protein [Patescibacteria group bacterium]